MTLPEFEDPSERPKLRLMVHRTAPGSRPATVADLRAQLEAMTPEQRHEVWETAFPRAIAAELDGAQTILEQVTEAAGPFNTTVLPKDLPGHIRGLRAESNQGVEDENDLTELRSVIDDHLGWADEESRERGDYVGRIIEVGDELDDRAVLRHKLQEAHETLDAWRPVVEAAIAWAHAQVDDRPTETHLERAVIALPPEHRPKQSGAEMIRKFREAAPDALDDVDAVIERMGREAPQPEPTDSGKNVPEQVHENGWQWRPTAPDTAFAPPFGTIRVCRVCGCLVAGGPTACVTCANAEPEPTPDPGPKDERLVPRRERE